MSVSDRLVLLNAGHIEQVGTAEDLYEEPDSEFVANFIGDINTMPGRLRSTNGVSTVDVDDQSFRLDGVHFDSGLEGEGDDTAVNLCIRPDNVVLSESSAEATALEGSIRNRIYKGGTVTYHVDTDVGTVTADVDTGRFGVDDNVYVSWENGAGYLFPQGESE
jgi:spermidine/putrescine transport system ATP-binding protein